MKGVEIKMTDTVLLRQKIEESGYKLRFIAQRLGITYQCLLNKINNESKFKATEILSMCELLHINLQQKEAIFFTRDVDEKSTKV